MSFNVVAAWPLAIVCASDRRLVGLISGKLLTNRSTKMTLFGCADAHGVIVYNGIGADDSGATPSDWLIELQEKKKAFDGSLLDLLKQIQNDLSERLRPIRTRYGARKARHTFVFGAWLDGISMIYGISNYEQIDSGQEAAEGAVDVHLSTVPPRPKGEIRIITTGAHSKLAERAAISGAIKQHEIKRVKALCVKAIRNRAYSGRGHNSVGSSAQWTYLGVNRDEVWCGLDVVGGANAQESPNLINIGTQIQLGGNMVAQFGGPGSLVRDTYAGGENASSAGQYDNEQKRFKFAEPTCGICGAPWPASQKNCEVCLMEQSVRRRGSESS